jgi:hypothetical protein
MDGWELEFDLVLNIAAMAGSWVGFDFRHEETIMRWMSKSILTTYSYVSKAVCRCLSDARFPTLFHECKRVSSILRCLPNHIFSLHSQTTLDRQRLSELITYRKTSACCTTRASSQLFRLLTVIDIFQHPSVS